MEITTTKRNKTMMCCFEFKGAKLSLCAEAMKFPKKKKKEKKMNFPEWGKPSNLDISSLFFISVVKFVLLVYSIVSVRYITPLTLQYCCAKLQYFSLRNTRAQVCKVPQSHQMSCDCWSIVSEGIVTFHIQRKQSWKKTSYRNIYPWKLHFYWLQITAQNPQI